MTSQWSFSYGSKPSNDYSSFTYIYNDHQKEEYSATDISNVIIPDDSLANYPSCATNRKPISFPEIYQLEMSFEEIPGSNYMLNQKNLLLQDLLVEMFFNSCFQETESSGSSPSFGELSYGSKSPEISDTDNHLFSYLAFEKTKGLVEYPTPLVKPGQVKKRKRKNIISRSKLGCWICRIKHLKCDESKPMCNNCIRFGIKCDYSPNRPDYVLDRCLRRQKLDSIIKKK